MGSIESGIPLKRDLHLFRSSPGRNSSNTNGFLGQRNRSRFSRFVFLKKLNYLQVICTLAVFFSFVFLLQMFFLPGSVMEDDKSQDLFKDSNGVDSWDLSVLRELGFGEDFKLEPLKLMEKFRNDGHDVNASVGSRRVLRYGYRKPKLAFVFGDLAVDPHQILMVTIASALQEIGYKIEVFSLEDGPVHSIWRSRGVPVSVITPDKNNKFTVDWLNYNGVLVNSLAAVDFLSCFMQDPFKGVPLVWTIHEQELAARLTQYVSNGQSELVDTWRKVFIRPSVIVFPNYILPVAYSSCDPGNYYVIPGYPEEVCMADKLIGSRKDNPTPKMKDDFIVVIVGSHLSYRGLWLEHSLVLQALYPIIAEFGDASSHLKINILAGDSASNYSSVSATVVLNLGYPKEMVKHFAVDEDAYKILSDADLVVYGSFLDERSFPDILLKAMCLEKTIIAPDLPMIRKYVSDRVNGYLYPKEDPKALTQIMFQMVSNGKLSLLARNAASIAKHTAKNLMVSESLEGYASLLQNILTFPSEFAVPKSGVDIPTKLKTEWQWHLFKDVMNDHLSHNNRTWSKFLEKVEKQWDHSHKDFITSDNLFSYEIWEEQKLTDIASLRKRREDEEVKDRTDQPRGTWDEVYKSARRADRSLHERDEGELERTGQPLCIYEPYHGEGTWPFLHNTSLYRGFGLSTKGRRPGADDVDGPSRLPLLSTAYYRDILGEYGAFFAIANRIDRLHRNAWIGFQSWRATARMVHLSKTAERSLLDAIESRKHGDTLYFWARLDTDSRNPLKQDFWSFCDAINAGNCQFAFSEALEKMYGLDHNLSSLPPMPTAEGTWSVMNCWVLPTKSFMEFVMFSRMFVDALDARFYEDHQKTGHCYLSLSKDKHCYSRLLELLVNVWAYHSARRMVYVDPETGSMQEQHMSKHRRGQMWIKWFQFSTLKSMDEDLAEEFDSDRPQKRWLWPSTGEIFWHGIFEKEKNMRNKEKEKKKQQSKDKLIRMRKRAHQKVLGKYVKPLVGEEGANSTTDMVLR